MESPKRTEIVEMEDDRSITRACGVLTGIIGILGVVMPFTKHYGGLVCSGLFVAVLLGQLTLAGIDFLYGEPKKNGDRRDGRR